MVSSFNERSPGTEAEAVQGPEAALGSLNAKVARRQKMVLLSGGGVATLLGLWFVIGGDSPSSSSDPNSPKVIETDGLVNRDLSQKEFVAIYGNRPSASDCPVTCDMRSRRVSRRIGSPDASIGTKRWAVTRAGSGVVALLSARACCMSGLHWLGQATIAFRVRRDRSVLSSS